MSKQKRFRLGIASEVMCQIYDLQAWEQYGNRVYRKQLTKAVVVGIDKTQEYPYEVVYSHPAGVGSFTYYLTRKEIKQVLSSGIKIAS